MRTLDHLSNGRIGWSSVASALDTVARHPAQPRLSADHPAGRMRLRGRP